MSFLGNIGGLLPATYQGYVKGSEQAIALQEQEDEAATNKVKRAAARDLMPLQVDADKQRLQNTVSDGKFQAETAPARQALERGKLQAQTDLQPGEAKLAKSKQDLELDQSIYSKVEQVVKGSQTADAAQEYMNSLAGKALVSGDMNTVNRVFGHMIDAPGVFPGLNGMPKPVKSDVVTAPAGAVDFTGAPIAGPAIQLTMPDGTTKLANPKYILQAHQKALDAQTAANIKITKPGDTARDMRTGKILFENEPKLPNGWIQGDDGELVFLGRGGAGGMGGSGSGAGGGKAGKSTSDAAVAAFKTAATNTDAKIPSPEMYAFGQELAADLMNQGAKSPEQAARVALDIATTGKGTKIDFNKETGTIDRVYSSKDFAGGRNVLINSSTQGLADFAKMVEPSVMTKAAADQMDHELSSVPAEQRAAVRAQWIQTASTPEKRAEAVAQMAEAKGPGAGQKLATKLELIGKYLPRDADTKKPGGSTWFGGGLTAPSNYKPDPTSAAGRAQAAQAKARAEGDQKAAAKAEQQQQLSNTFNEDARTMAPIDLVTKYNDQRFALPQSDLQTLNNIQKKL